MTNSFCLHEIAASDLEFNAIVNSLQKMPDRVDSLVGTIEQIDLTNKRVVVLHGFHPHSDDMDYDHLILALGCSANFFILPGIEASALSFKTLGDAVELRTLPRSPALFICHNPGLCAASDFQRIT